jgi:hypothetical protein
MISRFAANAVAPERPLTAAVQPIVPQGDKRPVLSLASAQAPDNGPNARQGSARKAKRSRPKLPPGISRSRTVTLRMSDWEVQEIQAAAESEGAINLSAYVRRILLPYVRRINDRAGANLAALAMHCPEVHDDEVNDGEG